MKYLLLTILKKILRILARLTILRYEPGIIGVTGTAGKSSTREAVRAALSSAHRVRASAGSFNNEIGLPLTILGDWKQTGGVFFWVKVIFASLGRLVIKSSSYPELLILEYGIDRPGDMRYLLQIARPQTGIVTSLGRIPVHVEFFTGPEQLVREKSRMVNQLPATGFALLNADDPECLLLRDETRARAITFGSAPEAEMRFTNFKSFIEKGEAVVQFKLTYGGSVVPVRLRGALGVAHAYAASAAAAAGLVFGMNLVQVAEALAEYRPLPGRLRVIPGIKDSTLIDDSYNASPLSMELALSTLRELNAKRKIAVLGDMLELGKYTMDAHRAVGKLVSETADTLFTVGVRAKFIAEAAEEAGFPKKNIFSFTNVKEAGEALQAFLKRGDLVLIKGSQGVRMEKIVLEVMADPENAERLLARQSKRWQNIPGLYDN